MVNSALNLSNSRCQMFESRCVYPSTIVGTNPQMSNLLLEIETEYRCVKSCSVICENAPSRTTHLSSSYLVQ